MALTMAIIGFGKSANRYHIPYIKERDIKIKYIYNHRRHREKEQGFYDADTIFTDKLDQVLNDSEVQLITICTPPATHFEYGKLVLEHGKNILIEKPFVANQGEAKELFALAQSKKLLAMPYQNRRFDSDYLTLKKVIELGYVGKLLSLESHFDKYRPDDRLHEGSQVDGQFYGLGVHMLDQILGLFGKPQTVSYDIRAIQNSASTVDDFYETQLFYDNFKATVVSNPLAARPYPRFLLHGTNGTYVKYDIDQQENDLKLGIMPGDPNFGIDTPSQFGVVKYKNQNGDWIEKQIPTINGDYGRVYDSIAKTLTNRDAKLVSDEQALWNMEILEAGIAEKGPHLYNLK
ncbi:oxidoreductase [Pediococcus pentosaceus]|uniref:oxidoreductase n=1 Tax=Pediococcus pentosaceus TaxID=1255 RepID=UPI001151928E|nr:oxidoreductase [Pediococcus pentosaceus]QDJ24853.1 oxidoreductase [Pediococcus pentosaceus]